MNKKGETEAGAEAITEFWKQAGMDTKGLFIHDGCGLSRYNGVSTEHLVYILCYMKKSGKEYNTFYESLPIAGKSGTVRSLCKGTAAQDNLRAKSGTIEKVKAYAGYVTTKSGKELAFAMIANNYEIKAGEVTDLFEALMIAMADLNE